MEQLRQFRKINDLTQDNLGDYLGIKKSFLSRIEGGKEKLPADKFRKLIDNDRGWDTSMLIEDSNNITTRAQGGKTASISIRNSNFNSGGEELAILRKENELLRERLADKDAQIDFLKKLLTK